jgi:hypothetical protein
VRRDVFYGHFFEGLELSNAWRRGDLGAVEHLTISRAAARDDERWKVPAGLDALRMFVLRREQDRLGETAPLLDRILASPPAGGLWVAGLVLLLAELGRHADARRVSGPLIGTDGRLDLPRDGLILLNGAFLAEAAFLSGDPRPAAALVALLRPLRGRMLSVMGGPGCHGPADRFLGLAAAAGGDVRTAREALAAAADLCRLVDAPLWLANCLCDLAQVTMAAEPLAEARRLAAGRRWPRVERRIAELAASMPNGGIGDAAVRSRAERSARG